MAIIYICGICKSSIDVNTKHFTIGSQIDLAGGPSEDDYETFDLCIKCELELLTELVYKSTKSSFDRMSYGIPVVKRIRQKIEAAKETK